MKRTSKRLLALLGGVLGLGAILRRRRHRPAPPAASPAAELKAKLAVTKEPELQTEPESQPELQTEPAPAPVPEPAATPDSVDERRADAHARARHAIEELGEKSD